MKENVRRFNIPVDHIIRLAVDQGCTDSNSKIYDLIFLKPAQLHDLFQAEQPLHTDKNIPANGVFMLNHLVVLDVDDVCRSPVIHHHGNFLDTPLNDLMEIFTC